MHQTLVEAQPRRVPWGKDQGIRWCGRGRSFSIVTKAARSNAPALGYTGACAFANILLTIAGSVILLL